MWIVCIAEFEDGSVDCFGTLVDEMSVEYDAELSARAMYGNQRYSLFVSSIPHDSFCW